MRNLTTEITIDAPASVVWEILTNLGKYEVWNPFIISSEGDVTEGSHLRNTMRPPGGKPTRFKPTVTAVESGKYFEWLGHLGVRGLLDGRHQFKLEAVGERTRFIQSEEFTGILVPLFAKMLDSKTKAGFEAMNQAIKERAEAVVTERG
ncbi:MAG: SRPBCC domain-containing protein [bacterium]|nr:SRPBCC domain-containing protein [bacterium]